MKSLKKLVKGIAFTLLFLLALLLLFIVLIKKMPEKEYSQLDATDRKMFDELTLQYKNFREKPDAIWTSSYRYDQEPLILIRSQKNKSNWRYIYLINAGKYIDPKKFKKIDFRETPTSPLYTLRPPWEVCLQNIGFRERLLSAFLKAKKCWPSSIILNYFKKKEASRILNIFPCMKPSMDMPKRPGCMIKTQMTTSSIILLIKNISTF